MVNVAADARIKQRFAGANLRGLKQNLVEQICQVSGGPCLYTGRDMKTAHTSMAISEAEFDAVVEDMAKSLDKFQVSAEDKGQLLALIGKMKGDIVGR
jgi:hemoglobin